MMRRRRLLALALLLLARPAAAAAADPPPEASAARGVLRGAVWRGAGAGGSLGGSACWLRGVGGEVRIEVAREGATPALAQAPAWGRLLTHGGEGWVALLAEGATVGGRWGGPLENLDPATAVRLATLLALLEGDAGFAGPWPPGVRALAARGGPRPRGGAQAADEREDRGITLRLPETAPLRAALEARGRGRGGGGETWRVRRTAADGLRIVSSRLPGRLELRVEGAWPVLFPPDDAFVPIWSLSELLIFPGARPGAAGSAEEAEAGAP